MRRYKTANNYEEAEEEERPICLSQVPVIAGKGRNLAVTLAREAEWHNMVQFHDKNGKY